MRALSTAELLTVWEIGTAQPAAQRASALLAAACADELEPDALAHWSFGRRDARLLELRAQIFGSRLTSLATCPTCRETLEFEIETRDLQTAAPLESPETFDFTDGVCSVRFRLPTIGDIAALDPTADLEKNRQELLGCCVLQAQTAGQKITAADLAPEVVRAISAQMAAADPQAELELALICPACGVGWNSPLEIVSFFWSEIHAWATRLLHEIHLLASAYGWREADIVALSPARRQIYLRLIQA